MKELRQIIQEFAQETIEDFVGVWSLIREIRNETRTENDQIIPLTVKILGELMRQGKIIAGNFKGDEFVKWELPIDEILKRIEDEWKNLDRDPDIGEIVWFKSKIVSATGRANANQK